MKKYKLAIIGATGLVGRTALKILEEKNIQNLEYTLFSSKKSAGTELKFMNTRYLVHELKDFSFDEHFDFAIFSAGAETSRHFAPIAASKGCVVIDNSSAFRMDDDVPLIVPEVNFNDVINHKNIIANPNCSTIQAVVALKPLDDKYKIKRIVYSTYQAVSGAGKLGLQDLENGRAKTYSPLLKFSHPIFDNCLPKTSTCVRVPVSNCHGESINVEFEKNFEISDVITTLKTSPGILVLNDDKNDSYPINSIANGHDDVLVGRIRRDFSKPNSLNLWVVADNLRKGAASNAIQIVEKLLNMEETYEK